VVLPEVGGVLPSRPVQLPSALIAAQPPPTLTLSYATLAWLTRAGGPVAAAGAASVDFRLVQWGAPPMSERAGVGGITYPPAAQPGAPGDSGGGGAALGRRRRARALGLLSSLSSFFTPSAWADMVSSAFTATRAQVNAAAPPPTSRADRLPSRPMDSRVFTIEVSSGGGAPVALNSIPGGPPGGLFYITVPLRDLSIVNYGPRGAAGVEVGQSLLPRARIYNVSCPLQLGDAVPARALPALDVSLSPPAAATVTIVRGFSTAYDAPVVEGEAAGSGAAARRSSRVVVVVVVAGAAATATPPPARRSPPPPPPPPCPPRTSPRCSPRPAPRPRGPKRLRAARAWGAPL
jgi:hypothetical protein